MVDSLFEGLMGGATNYFGATQLFPEVDDFLRMESGLKGLNLQLGKAVTGIDKFGTKSGKAFREYNISIVKGEKALVKYTYRVDTLQSSIYSNAAMLGLSTKNMIDLTEATVEYGKVLSRETLATLSTFSEITGKNADALGTFTAKLLASRRIEDSQTTDLIKNILAYREQYGLASEDIDELLDITNKYADIVGATGDRVVESTGKMTKFISVIKQTGLEASFATNLIEKMIDPTRMQDNILLLSKLGFTMEELNFGDPMDNIEESLPRLKQLAKEITSIPSRIAAANIAELYGMTLEEMRKLAEMDTSQREIDRQKSLTAYRRERQTATEYFGMIKDSFFGGIALVFNKVANIFSPLTELFGLKAAIPIGYLTIKAITRFFKSSFGKALDEMATSFINKLSKAFSFNDSGEYEERASLVGKKRKGYMDSSGLTEGLVESESRRKEISNVYANYIKQAGETNKDIFDKRAQFLQEATGGKELTFFQKEIMARDKFASRKVRPGRDNAKALEEITARTFENYQSAINNLEGQKNALDVMFDEGRIGKEALEKMKATIGSQITNVKNQFKEQKNTVSGQALLQKIYSGEREKLINQEQIKTKANAQIENLKEKLQMALNNSEFVEAEAIRRLISGYEKQSNDAQNLITSINSNIEVLGIEVGNKNIVDLQLEKAKLIKEIEEDKAQLSLAGDSEETIRELKNSIRRKKERIKKIDSETAQIEAKRKENNGEANPQTAGQPALAAQSAEEGLKTSEKFLKKNGKKNKKAYENMVLHLAPDAKWITRQAAKMKIGATSPFTSMIRGISSGGFRGGLSGLASGMANPVAAIALGTVATGVGALVKLSMRSEKTQQAMSAYEKSKDELLNNIADKLSGAVVPVLNTMAKAVNFLTGSKKEEEERATLEDYALAEFTTATAANGELLVVMKEVNKKMGVQINMSRDSAMFSEIMARSATSAKV